MSNKTITIRNNITSTITLSYLNQLNKKFFLLLNNYQFTNYNLSINNLNLGRLDLLEKQAATYVWDGIRLARRHNKGQMVLYYIIYTVIQAMNALLMFYWLNDIIDSPMYSFQGPSVIMDVLSGRSWEETGHFARITHCDVPRRMLSKSHVS